MKPALDAVQMSWASMAKVCHPSLRETLPPALAGIPAKVIARVAGATPAAAKRWKAGDNTPCGDALLRLCAEFETVWAVVRQHARRPETDAEQMLTEFHQRLVERRRRNVS